MSENIVEPHGEKCLKDKITISFMVGGKELEASLLVEPKNLNEGFIRRNFECLVECALRTMSKKGFLNNG